MFFDGLYTKGKLTIKGGCKIYDNNGLLYASAIDLEGGETFDNMGLVVALQRIDLKNIKNVVNQVNCIIQSELIDISSQKFTNNGLYTANISTIVSPKKIDHKNGRFSIKDSATFDFGESTIDALFASEGKVVLKGKSLVLNQEVQVKELEITTTQKLILTDMASIKAETITLNGKKIENNGQIDGNIVTLSAHELKHLKGMISSEEDLYIQAFQTTSEADLQGKNIYVNKTKMEKATFTNQGLFTAKEGLYIGYLSALNE
jgi:hypothetical protein